MGKESKEPKLLSGSYKMPLNSYRVFIYRGRNCQGQYIEGRVRAERARFCLTLLRFKHNKIKTHWTKYSREWHESNLWDSWFRMLTIARIDNSISLSSSNWGFINFPGIGHSYILSKN